MIIVKRSQKETLKLMLNIMVNSLMDKNNREMSYIILIKTHK